MIGAQPIDHESIFCMKLTSFAAAGAATLALALAAGPALAQGTNTKPSTVKPAAKTPAKKPTAAKKAPAKKGAKRVPAKTVKAVEAHTPVQSPSNRLTEAELETAKRIHTGKIQCELGADVTVTADEKNPGFFHVAAGKQRYYMHPVESRTGAIRLEDNRAGAMWLQLGNKSMLMNQKAGQRVADECAASEQRAFAEEMKKGPAQPGLLDGTAKN